MSDYNNGQIHGWNGGECPVHTQSKVNVWLRGKSGSFDSSAGQLWWGHDDKDGDIVCFQVTKPYAEPKVIWVNEWPNGAYYSYQSEEFAKALSETGSGAVRSAVKYVEAKE